VEKERQKANSSESDVKEWEARRDAIVADHAAKLEAYSRNLIAVASAHAWEVEQWKAERVAFLSRQNEQHEAVDAFRAQHEAKDPAAITEYCHRVLANSEYPDCLPREFDLDFNHDNGVLVVDYKLPAPSEIPTLVEVK